MASVYAYSNSCKKLKHTSPLYFWQPRKFELGRSERSTFEFPQNMVLRQYHEIDCIRETLARLT